VLETVTRHSSSQLVPLRILGRYSVPFSSNAFDYYIGTVVRLLQPRRVCDIGPGAGKYAGIVRRASEQHGFAAHLTAVEIDESCVAQYALRSLYDEVIVADADQLIDNPRSRFDLVIIGTASSI
jgi:predicted TPR repeat methyltransferase